MEKLLELMPLIAHGIAIAESQSKHFALIGLVLVMAIPVAWLAMWAASMIGEAAPLPTEESGAGIKV